MNFQRLALASLLTKVLYHEIASSFQILVRKKKKNFPRGQFVSRCMLTSFLWSLAASSPRRKLSTTTTSPFEGAGPDYYPSSSTLKRSNTLSSAKGRLIMNFAAASSSTSVLPAEKPPSGLKRSKTAPSKRQKAREQQENTKPSSKFYIYIVLTERVK